ncbi:MAG TPA: YIP1 family protein [Longimicrobiales bacterium]|nr:YIP1 family protein [Longimicrobiales bacterium]
MSDTPSPPLGAAAPGTPTAEPASRLDDYVDIYLAPSDVFDRRRDGRWGQALLVLTLVSVVLYYLFLPAATIIAEETMARAYAEAVAENPEAAEAMGQMQGFGATMVKLGGIMVIFGMVASVFLLGVVIKGLSALLGAALTFAQALVVATFARFVLIPRTLAVDLSVIWADRGGDVDVVSDTSFGVLRFLDAASLADPLVPLLERLDLFAMWEAALWAVGIYVIARTTKGVAIGVAALTLLVATIPGLIGAFIG